MAKKKFPIVGVVLVVGMMAFILLLGSGTFQNFSVQDVGASPTPTPSSTHAATDSPGMPTLWQQIQNIFNSFVQWVKDFLGGLGIKI